MKKKVYIAGPITGDPTYKEKFAAVSEKLKALGLDPVNPAEAPEGLTYKEYIDRGLKLLMECDIICCITTERNPNKKSWPPSSKGENLEWHYAMTVGIPLMKAFAMRSEKGAKWNVEIPMCWDGMFITEKEEKND